MRILIDTSVLVSILRGDRKLKEKLKKLAEENELIISGITEAEIFSGKDMDVKEKREKIADLIEKFSKINPTNKIMREAGRIRRKYGIPLLDSIIIATAEVSDAVIFTLDRKHFKKVEEVKLVF